MVPMTVRVPMAAMIACAALRRCRTNDAGPPTAIVRRLGDVRGGRAVARRKRRMRHLDSRCVVWRCRWRSPHNDRSPYKCVTNLLRKRTSRETDAKVDAAADLSTGHLATANIAEDRATTHPLCPATTAIAVANTPSLLVTNHGTARNLASLIKANAELYSCDGLIRACRRRRSIRLF